MRRRRNHILERSVPIANKVENGGCEAMFTCHTVIENLKDIVVHVEKFGAD